MSYVIHLRLVVTPPRRRRDLRSGEAAEIHLVEVALLPSEGAALRLEVTPVASPAMLGREIRLGEVVVLAQARNKSERKCLFRSRRKRQDRVACTRYPLVGLGK